MRSKRPWPAIPADPVNNYRLGLAYLNTTPPQSIDGFWYLARAINLKVPDADKIKDYLRKAIYNYEQPGCDSFGGRSTEGIADPGRNFRRPSRDLHDSGGGGSAEVGAGQHDSHGYH